ncbi:hypothetical protein [Enterovibrio norvegicus]|uniref:hypothetical protein n=1 Tax=Enterovibrio norvegicus TaxID=188144 RepID=UPI001F53D23D|nr:hypothetical protein [Enterovibrio norvegicus]
MKFRSSIGTIEHGSALCGELKQFLIENEPEYGASLVPNLSHISFLAKNNTGIDIDDVTHLVGNEYQLKYRYKWSIYNGCADMDLDGEESTTVVSNSTFTIMKRVTRSTSFSARGIGINA